MIISETGDMAAEAKHRWNAALFIALVGWCGCEAASGLRQPVFASLFQEASCERFVDCGLFADQASCIAGTASFVVDDLVPDCPCYDSEAARDCVAALQAGEGNCGLEASEVEYPAICYDVCCPGDCNDPACEVLGVRDSARCERIYEDLGGEMQALRDELLGDFDIGEECFSVPYEPTSHPDSTLESKLPHPEMEIRAVYFGRASDMASKDALACGAKPDGVTLCAGLMAPAAGVYALMYETLDPMPFSDPEKVYELGFVFDDDGNRENNFVPPEDFPGDFFANSDRWYIANYSPSTGWRISAYEIVGGEVVSVPSLARFVLRGRAGALIIPDAELEYFDPEARISIFRHDGSLGLVEPNDWSGQVFPTQQRPLARRVLRRPF